ncbi:MAG: hypothetical protein J6Z22_00825, partial [Lachnospiraceae bacterium]|nr:hypothetical protein [Lachnospiraceae bacterium]
MKRKVVAIMLAMAISVSITGCTNMNGAQSSQESAQESTASQSSQEETKESEVQSTEESGGQEEQGQVIPQEKRKESILQYGYGDYAFFGIDQLGNKLYEYHWDDIKDELKDQGYDFSNASVYALGDGYVFLNNYESGESSWVSHVYAVDTGTLEVVSLMVPEENYYFTAIDYYDGKVYITFYGPEGERKEYVYAREGKTFAFQGEQSEKESYFQALTDCSVYVSSAVIGDHYGGCSITRSMDENGYVLVNKDGSYYKVSKDGLLSKISALPESYVSIYAYDAKGVVFEGSDEGAYTLFYADYATGSAKKIADTKETVSFLAYQDGTLYYSVRHSKNLVLATNEVYQLNTSAWEKKKLYEKTSTPGATDITPGTQGFKIVDGKVYYIDLVDKKVAWVTGDLAAGSFTAQNTGFVLSEKTAFLYGTILDYEFEKLCDSCGISLERYYGEAFQLDKKYSEFADKINATLRAKPEMMLASYNEAGGNTYEATCEEHLENPTIWCESQEEEVTGVTELGDHYLAVNYGGYWYAGGAHGYPSIDQLIFDLNTGDQVTFKDFYTGSEESFKELVATKTKEDYLSYPGGGAPYFAENAQEVYKEAYKRASIESSVVWFEPNGVFIVYPPYDMGPYA